MPTLLIFAAIVLRNGESVLQVRGEPGTERVYPRDPVRLARLLRKENTRALHIVDLDLAERSSTRNRDAIRDIARAADVRIPIQVCGGIRSYDDARDLIEQRGADRVVIGTVALEQPALIRELIAEFSAKKIIIAIEARGGQTCTQNGAIAHDITPIEHAHRMKECGVERVLYTDLDAVHGHRPLDLQGLASFALDSGMTLTVNGGVRGVADLNALDTLLPRRIDSVVLADVLYENRFSCQGLWRKAEAMMIRNGTFPG